MQSRLEDIRRADAEIVAVCVDSIEQNAKLIEDLELDFPILSDSDLTAIDLYDVRHEQGNTFAEQDIARPAVFVLDREGIVRWRELTDNYRVRVRPETILNQLAAIP